MSQYYGKDAFYWPIEITSGSNDTIVVKEYYHRNGTDSEATITVSITDTASLAETGADYYSVGGSARVSPNAYVKSVYDAVTTALDFASSNTGEIEVGYTFAPAQGGQGLEITVAQETERIDGTFDDDGSVFLDYVRQIDLVFSDSNFTFPPELLGFDPDRTTDYTLDLTDAPTVNGSTPDDQSFVMPYSRDGVFVTPVVASDKRSDVVSRVFESSRVDTFRSYANAWNATYSNRFYYRNVIGPHVWPHDRTDDSTNQTLFGGEFITDDPNHALHNLWVNSRLNEDILVVHNEGDQGWDWDARPIRLQRLSPNFKRSFRTLIADFDASGETYDVDFEMVYLPYDQYDAGIQSKVWRH